jgi:hypothetical protein
MDDELFLGNSLKIRPMTRTIVDGHSYMYRDKEKRGGKHVWKNIHLKKVQRKRLV